MNSQLLHKHSRQLRLCPVAACSGYPALYPASAGRHGARPSRHRRRHSVASRRQVLLLGSSGLLASSLSNQQANAAFVEELVLPFAQAEESEVYAADPPTRVTATGRIVAIGDLHGDWEKAVNALQVAGVAHVDEETLRVQWCGGDTVVVQLGDVLDRGDNEIAIVQLLRAMDEQAREQGGAVYMLNGNHESLNVCGDFRYVTPAALLESAMYAGLEEGDLTDWAQLGMVREKMFKPGGPMARELSRNPTVLIVNNTAFAHGGLLPFHVSYGIERINAEVAAWMRGDSTPDGGKAQPPFLAMGDASSVMWNRTLSRERFATPYDRMNACLALKQALSKVGASRLVVGHTPQLMGANAECDGLVWRIDVGMSQGVLGRPVQVLEIEQDPLTQSEAVRVLTQANNSNSLFIDDYMGSFDL